MRICRALLGFGFVVAFLTSPALRAQMHLWGTPCGMECFETAAEAGMQCREDGGSFWECMEAASDAMAACRAEAGCEDDGHHGFPAPCGMECFTTAREASSLCREEGGSFWECIGVYREAVSSCREDLECEVPELPPLPCGVECFDSARAAFGECREADGSFGECAEVFVAELRSCRELAGCGMPEEEEENLVLAALVAPGAEFTRGDANDDGVVNLTDPIALLNHLFLGAAGPDCLDAADANDDGELDLSDPTAILITLFLGNRPLPAPGLGVGLDPTPDELGCREF